MPQRIYRIPAGLKDMTEEKMEFLFSGRGRLKYINKKRVA